jgi:hypothetical protein
MSKIFLQTAASCINFFLIFEFKKNDGSGEIVDVDYIDLVYIFYGLTWLWSMYVQFYEYKRGLPHAWYCHQLFWTLSFLSYTVMLALILFKENWRLNDYFTDAVLYQIYSCFALMAIISILLTILGLLVKKEYKFNENRNIFIHRNYLPNSQQLTELEESYINHSVSEDRLQDELPVIQANVKAVLLEGGDEVVEIQVYKN